MQINIVSSQLVRQNLQFSGIFTQQIIGVILLLTIFIIIGASGLVVRRRRHQNNLIVGNSPVIQQLNQLVNTLNIPLGRPVMQGLVHTEHNDCLIDPVNGLICHYRAVTVQTDRICRHIGSCSQIPEFQLPVRMPCNIIIVNKFLITDACIFHLGNAVADKADYIAIFKHTLIFFRHYLRQLFLQLRIAF